MSMDDFVDTGIPIARIASAYAGGPLQLHVVWAEGARAQRSETVDLAPVVGSYKIYRPLRDDPALFSTVRLIEEGNAVAWSHGKISIEMSADIIDTASRCGQPTPSPAGGS
jgi:hypothetical protein